MIPLYKTNISPLAIESIKKVLDSGYIAEGEQTDLFTNELRKLFQTNQVVCTNSGTSALTLALRLSGVKPGDQVISSPFTAPATNCAISSLGGYIIWGDLNNKTTCLDLDKCLSKLDHPKDPIKAVVLVLIGGIVPEGLDSFYLALKKKKVKLILDCAHSLLTEYHGKHISHYGDYCCFSFQAIKHLTTGDGGAITCSSEEDYERVKKLKWFGLSREVPPNKTKIEYQMEYTINEWGYKFHMNNINAAIGLANIPIAIDSVNKSRENALYFSSFIKENNLDLYPIETDIDSNPSWWTYGFTLGNKYKDLSLLDLCKRFANYEIEVSPLWRMNSEHNFYSKKISVSQLRTLFIPNGFWITELERNLISNTLIKVFG